MSAAVPSQLVWLYDALGNQKVALHQLQAAGFDWQWEGSEELRFSIDISDPKAAYLQPDQLVRWEDRLYRNVEMFDARTSAGIRTDVRCEALWYDLIARIKVGNYALLGFTPQAGLIDLLTNTGWSVGTVTTDVAIYSAEGNDKSVLEHLKTWAAVTGNELEFDTLNQTVSLMPSVGVSLPIAFRYGRNIAGITRRTDRPRSTRLYAFGAGGLSISGSEPAGLEYVENYDWYINTLGITLTEARALYRKDQVWVDERFLTSLSLYDAALARSARLAVPILSYSVDVADLTDVLSTAESTFRPGDYVPVTDLELDIDVTTRVVRYVRDLLKPQSNQIELDFLRGTLGDSSLTSDQRSVDYAAVSVLVDSNADPLTITGSLTAFATITITVGGTTTPVLGATFVGTGSGTGTVQIYAAINGTDIGARISASWTDGQQVEVSWPTYVADLAEGTYTLDWRAVRTVGAGTIAVGAEKARAWALVRGAVGVGFASTPNQTVLEEVFPMSVRTMSDGATALIEVPTYSLTVTAAPEAATLGTITDDVILPFTLDHPVFGMLDGVGRLAPPLADEWNDI